MQRIVLLMLGMASLVASGVIMDRGRVGLNAMGGLGLQTVQGVRGGFGDRNVLSKDELLKQKFILDLVQQIYVPLQQQDLLMLEDRNLITNEDLYLRPLTQEMHDVLDLIRNNQMLDKQTIFNVKNEQHILQAVGLYRLLLNARDFVTFKRLAVYARQNISNELFVHCLIAAMRERQDTQMLIVPAFHEILPQLLVKDRIIDQVRRQLDTGVSTLRPQLTDVIGLGRRNSFLNSRMADQQQQGGLFGILNRSQLWMPWRDLHQQIAFRKMVGGNIVQQDGTQMGKVIISLPGNGLLCQDIGLKSYVAVLLGELVLNQDTIRKSNKNYGGKIGLENDINENMMLGGRGQRNGDDIMGGIRKNHYDNDYFSTNRQFNTAQEEINSDRLLNVGRRSRNNLYGVNYGVNDEFDQNIYGNRRNLDLDVETDNVMDRNQGGKHFGYINDDQNNVFYGGKNRFSLDEDIDVDRNLYMGRNNMHEGQYGINTVSINDPRLLFVSRRRKNPNNVVNMDNSRYQMDTNQYDEDDYISGGRRVSNERNNNERQRSKYNSNYDNNDVTFDDINGLNNYRYMKNIKRDKILDIDNGQDDLYFNTHRGFNSKDDYQNYQDNDYINRNSFGRGFGQEGMGVGRNINDFLNVITRGRIGQKEYFDNDQDVHYNRGYIGQNCGESLDKYLPTTDINDERLLHINRRRLNNVVEGRQMNNQGGFTYNNDNDDYVDYYNRYNSEYQGYPRGNINKQRSYNGEQNYMDAMQQDYQNVNNRDDKRGHRYRRSIVNKELGQTSTINGNLVLYALQQLVARLNIERIALGQPLLLANSQTNLGRGIAHNLMRLSGSVNVDVQTINKIENILQYISQVLEQRVGQITIPSYNQKINEIGLILAGQIEDLGFAYILGDILEKTSPQARKGLLINMLENEAAQILLAGIVQVVDQKLQQIYLQREEFISAVRSITVNNVGVDKLQTFVEQTDIDLSNLLNNNNNVEQTMQGNGKMVVGRIPRLNHKSFNIEIDVTSDRQQQVVIRNLLIPKVDGQNNIIPLVERRQNVIVLDVTTAELQQGRNTLKLKSKEITITSRDTTPLTKIYQMVMEALNGDVMLQQDLLAGQSTLLPHRLLLPRGRATGLPMQLITVITPLTGSSGIMGFQKGAELNTLFLDNLPLNYPLHCDITNLDDVVSMPNLMVKDVKIYHEE